MANFNDTIATQPANGPHDPVDFVNRDPPTGIDVVIVGAGVGGLMAALECHRKGHSVHILERSMTASAGGDMFTIGLSGRRVLEHYPAMERELDVISLHDNWAMYRQWNGQALGEILPFAKITGAPPGADPKKAPMMMQLRPLFHAMLYHQIQRFGIPVSYGQRVTEYYENATAGTGGVITDTNERFEADLVLAADGLHSRAKRLISGTEQKGKSSGKSILRSAFPLETALMDSEVKEYFDLHQGKPVTQTWSGPDTHAMTLSYVDKNGQNGRMCWGLTFKESGEQSRVESWNHTVTSDDAIRVMDQTPGWAEPMKKLVLAMPKDSIVYWPLILRDPNPTWHSPGCRVLMIGDAAHSFLPTSGNGATQAIEDAITIASCLRKAGKGSVTEAVKVHTLLRSERVACAQLLGFVNAQRLHKNTSQVGGDRSKVQQKVPKWVFTHNPEQYANDNYAAAAASLKGGPAFTNTNIPPGSDPKPWTLADIERLESEGKDIELSGDWS